MTGSPGARVRQYWNTHIHDLEITRHPVGSPGFFADLDAYHFEKLHHLLRLVDFTGAIPRSEGLPSSSNQTDARPLGGAR